MKRKTFLATGAAFFGSLFGIRAADSRALSYHTKPLMGIQVDPFSNPQSDEVGSFCFLFAKEKNGDWVRALAIFRKSDDTETVVAKLRSLADQIEKREGPAIRLEDQLYEDQAQLDLC